MPDRDAPRQRGLTKTDPEGSAAFDASLIQSQSAEVTSSTAADAAHNPERDYEVALRRVGVTCSSIARQESAKPCLLSVCRDYTLILF